MTTREDILSLAVPTPREPDSDAEWDLEQRAFYGANNFKLPDDTRTLIADLWAEVVARENWFAAPTPPAAEALEKDRITDRLLRFDPALMRAVDTRAILLEAAAHIVELRAKNSHLHSKLLLSAPPAAEAPGQEPVALTYTNWRGETAERSIIPRGVWFGSTDWHPEPQWLLSAFDVEKQADRDFALKDFGSTPPTYADAEAKGELDVDATAENIARHVARSEKTGRIHQVSYEAAKAAALLAIRSLASPAPKGET